MDENQLPLFCLLISVVVHKHLVMNKASNTNSAFVMNVYVLLLIMMYHHCKTNDTPQRRLPAHIEATLDFSRGEFTCP